MLTWSFEGVLQNLAEIGRSHSEAEGSNGTGGMHCFDVDAERPFLNRQLLDDVLGLLSSTDASSSTCTPLSLAFLPMLLRLRRRDIPTRFREGNGGRDGGAMASSKWLAAGSAAAAAASFAPF